MAAAQALLKWGRPRAKPAMKTPTLSALLFVATLSVSGLAATAVEKSACDGLSPKCPAGAAAPASGDAGSGPAHASALSSSSAPAPAVAKPPGSRIAAPRKAKPSLPAHLFM